MLQLQGRLADVSSLSPLLSLFSCVGSADSVASGVAMGVMPPAASLPPMPVISSGNISAPVLHGFASSANGNVIFGHPTDPSHGDDARHLVICNKWAISNAARRHVFGGWRHASATATAWSRRSWSSSSLKCSSCNLKPG